MSYDLNHATALFAQLHNEQDDWDTYHWGTEPTPQPAGNAMVIDDNSSDDENEAEPAWYYWIDDGFQGPEMDEDGLLLLQQLDDAEAKWQQKG